MLKIMNKLERLQSYVDNLTKNKDDVIKKIISNYEASLPKELQGLFEYSPGWSNSRTQKINMTCDDVKMTLVYCPTRNEYTVTFNADKHYNPIESHEKLAKKLLRCLSKEHVPNIP